MAKVFMISAVKTDSQKQDTSLGTNDKPYETPQTIGGVTLKINSMHIPRIVVIPVPVRVVKSSKMKGLSLQVDEVVAKVVQKFKTLSL